MDLSPTSMDSGSSIEDPSTGIGVLGSASMASDPRVGVLGLNLNIFGLGCGVSDIDKRDSSPSVGDPIPSAKDLSMGIGSYA